MLLSRVMQNIVCCSGSGTIKPSMPSTAAFSADSLRKRLTLHEDRPGRLASTRLSCPHSPYLRSVLVLHKSA